MPISRRQFLKLGAGTFAGLMVAPIGFHTRATSVRAATIAAIPGGTLDLTSVTKYAMPLVIPPAMPAASNNNKNKYDIAVRQFRQQILPTGLPTTTVWSYGSKKHPSTFHYPAFTIEAEWNKPVQVLWRNELLDAQGNYLPHLLPVDQTLHWANPPGGTTGRDMRPMFSSTPGPYTGPVPIVTHVHGAHTTEDSDGYPEAWWLPNANNIPKGYARTGTYYDIFNKKYKLGWQGGTASFKYPNDQRATTLWYHDHTLGMTRLNVYAGPAGFYLIRGGPDDVVLDSRSNTAAVLPGPAPKVGDSPFGNYGEIPIAIQDRSFNDNGSLFYPDSREFFDGATASNPGFIPGTDLSPIWNPEFFGNMMVVNGRTWPYLNVEPRRYRFRLLNGCNSRFLILQFEHPGVEVWQIGAEGGFLPAPIRLNNYPYPGSTGGGATVLLGLAERADVIVDFSAAAGTSFRLLNLGPDEPFGGGEIGIGFLPSDAASTGQVMEFRVSAGPVTDPTTPPQFLQLPAIAPLGTPAAPARPLSLNEMMSMSGFDGPAEALLGTMNAGVPVHKMWMDPITENPAVGAVEDWEFYNFTADAHPIHVHLVQFEVINREGLVLNDVGEVALPASPVGAPRPPEPWESGRKDTVIAYPGEVTRIRARFDTPGLFVWHCHIVEHEDNEMMRPYRIGP